jgi:hypothetical protein
MKKVVGLVEDPVGFFASIGLHDVRIDALTLDVDSETLRFAICDLFWNMERTDEYPGRFPCTLVFADVHALFLDVEVWDGLRIDDHEIAPSSAKPGYLRLDLDLNIGGGARSIGFDFKSLVVEANPAVPSSRD